MLRTKLVAQGANIPCTPGAEKYLHDHQVLCLPDYVVNAGGVICAASEYQRLSQQQAMARIEETLRQNTAHILKRSVEERCPPRTAADALARERLVRVMTTKRWSIF
jgi:glutamate dehydrogenase (NAD(P)+)